MTTDTSEKGLESLIVRAMTGRTDLLSPPHVATETSVPVAGGTGWLLGDPKHYDRGACVDLVQLRGFIQATQPKTAETLALDTDGPSRYPHHARSEPRHPCRDSSRHRGGGIADDAPSRRCDVAAVYDAQSLRGVSLAGRAGSVRLCGARDDVGASVSLHHLDPRQEVTGAKPDVRIIKLSDIGRGVRFVFTSPTNGLSGRPWSKESFPTKSAALASARKAAGFAHVAEQACQVYEQSATPSQCVVCGWLRKSHGVQA